MEIAVSVQDYQSRYGTDISGPVFGGSLEKASRK